MSHRLETQTIYEIFRACRLCGAGGGFKMPILQCNLLFESGDMELKKKIQECVQIEVKESDKMPPLICELCIDKVNDFYEFLEMCRQTNNRTRQRLGLPLQNVPQGVSNSEDCILGVTEQICPKSNPVITITKPGPKSLKHTLVRTVNFNRDESSTSVKGKKEVEWSIKGKDDDEGKSKKDERDNKGKKDGKGEKDWKGKKDDKDNGKKEEVRKEKGGRRWQKELKNLNIMDNSMMDSSRSSRSSRNESTSSSASSRSSRSRVTAQPAPARDTRRSAGNDSDTSTPSRTRRHQQEPLSDDESLLVPRAKRRHEKDVRTLEPPVKIARLNAARSPTSPPKVSPKTSWSAKALPPPPSHTCPVCQKQFKSTTAMISHRKSHGVTFIEPQQNAARSPSPPPKASPKTSQSARALPPPPSHTCSICQKHFKSTTARISHTRTHGVNFTNPLLACNACGEWFASEDEAAAHHKRHRTKSVPYHCRRCGRKYKHQMTYDEHFAKQCVPWQVAPDAACPPRPPRAPGPAPGPAPRTLREQHDCAPLPAASNQCGNCSQVYASSKSLRKHQKKCLKKKVLPIANNMKIEAKLLQKLKPIQVRVARCDPVLRGRRGRCDAAGVPALYGLDKNCVYPFSYGGLRIKSEPLDSDGMVSIKQEIRDEFYKEEDYVHWDSDMSTDSEEELETTSVVNPFARKKKVDSLTTLSLKTIFSKRCLGKVPRKLRKVKSDKLFDSLFNPNELENDVNLNKSINNIIGSLDNDDENATINLTGDNDNDTLKVIGNDAVTANVDYDSDSLLDDEDKSKERVSNNDFDSLFKNNNEGSNNDVTQNDDKDITDVATTNDTQVESVASVDKELTVSRTEHDKEDDDTVSLRSTVSNKTNYDSVSQNGDLKNNELSDAAVDNDRNNDNGEIMIEGSVTSGKVNGKSKYDDIISSDVENKLLDELIGENETISKGFSSSETEKVNKLTLEDVVSNKDELKSLDLDNVSDEEFNFDI